MICVNPTAGDWIVCLLDDHCEGNDLAPVLAAGRVAPVKGSL